MANRDPSFPECCTTCPHRDPFTGSCTHETQQTLRTTLTEDEPCPIYIQEKNHQMTQLLNEITN